MIEVLFYPITWFCERPYLAVFPALIFGLCFFGLRHSSSAVPRRNALAASILWLVYAIYEWRMYVWSETVSNPIRVDLLVITPILYFGAIKGLLASIVCFRQTRGQERLRRRLLIGLGTILLLLTACVAGEYLFITRPSDEEYSQRNLLSQVAYDLGVHREEHGTYPRDLNELVVAGFPPGSSPEMLRQFRYASDGASFTLSCVGVHTREVITINSADLAPNPSLE